MSRTRQEVRTGATKTTQRHNRIQAGELVGPYELFTIHSKPVRIPDLKRIVHLQFRRFAGCPVCDLHLHSIVNRHRDLVAASICEVVVFHSNGDALLPYAGELPFAVVADPEKKLYSEFGVQSSPRSLLHPQAWPAISHGIARSIWRILQMKQAVPPINPHGGRFGLPADFLISSDGRVLACKYGAHVYDQWSVDEILALTSVAA